MRSRASRIVLNQRGAIAALAAAMALLVVPAGASATSPVLEFVAPSAHGEPVTFETGGGEVTAVMADSKIVVHCTASHGEGKITGQRWALAQYKFTGCNSENPASKCSTGATPEEITTSEIPAELVYVNQTRHEVAILLNPGGGEYMSFECSKELVKATGSFLAPVTPLNKEVRSFTTTLSEQASVQTPDEYEGELGERLTAIPMGAMNAKAAVTTGVESTITVTTSVPVEIRAVTARELEAKQREEAQTTYQEEVKRKEAAANKRREEEAAASKTREEELTARLAVVEGRLKELLAKQQAAKKSRPTRAQLLAQALTQCKKQPKRKRAKCRATAEKLYGPKAGKKHR